MNKNVFGIDRSTFIRLVSLYAISQGGIFLILNALYWDDWTIYPSTPGELISYIAMLGPVFNLIGRMHNLMLPFGLWLYRVLTFILMFGSGLFLWHILARNKWIQSETKTIIIVLFLTLPFNWARVALIDFPYTLCYFMFFSAWYLMDRFRPLALSLFLFSFTTNSLLVFYLLPVADLYYRQNEGFEQGKRMINL